MTTSAAFQRWLAEPIPRPEAAGLLSGLPLAGALRALDRERPPGPGGEGDGETALARRTPSAPPTGRFLDGRLVDRRGLRDYRLYVPPQAATGRPLPLVVMLHGCLQSPEDFAAGTRMNEAADELGVLVLYPAQCARANFTRCWNWHQPGERRRDAGEAGLLVAMVREVMASQPVDASRVYAAGLSAGGAMAAVLGAAYPDVFAAIGVHSALPPTLAHDLSSALAAMRGEPVKRPQPEPEADTGDEASLHFPRAFPPLIVFHGDADDTVHPSNSERWTAFAERPVSQENDAAAPAEDDDCGCGCGGAGDCHETAAAERLRGAAGDGPRARRFTRRLRRDAAGHVVAEHWSVHGAGHAWSGGSPRGSFTDPDGPSATAAMLRFFLSHTIAGPSPSTAPRRPRDVGQRTRAGDVLSQVVVVMRRGLAFAHRRARTRRDTRSDSPGDKR